MQQTKSSHSALLGSTSSNARQCDICHFYHRLLDYLKPDEESLPELFGSSDDQEVRHLEWKLHQDHHPNPLFQFVNLPSKQVARDTANRSVLVKGICELCGEGANFKVIWRKAKLPFLTAVSAFRITVDCFGNAVVSLEEQPESFIHPVQGPPLQSFLRFSQRGFSWTASVDVSYNSTMAIKCLNFTLKMSSLSAQLSL